MLSNYKGPIKLRNEDYYFYFREGTTKLQHIPPQPAREDPLRPGWWDNPVLGTWGGTLTLLGYDFYNMFGKFALETKYHSGDIWVYKIKRDGAPTKVWFDGSGKLALFLPDYEVKHTQAN